MSIISNFPCGSGSGGGGLALETVTNIKTLTTHEKVYIQWSDPDDLAVAGSVLAAWGGTLLVRKAGSAPVSRRDGVIVLDSKTRNAYKDSYFCDSGLTAGVTYYYKLFPYTTSNLCTDVDDGAFSAVPDAVAVGNVSGISLEPAGNGKMAIRWTDPDAAVVADGITVASWASTVVVVKAGGYAVSPADPDAAYTCTSTTRNGYAGAPLVATGLENGTAYYVSLFPMTTDGKANTDAANRKIGTANRLVIANEPAQSGTLTYNGNSQSPVWSSYDSAQLTLGGAASATNAGTYSAVFTPQDDYMWADGSIAARAVPWSIGKTAGSLTLGASSVTLNASNLTATVSVTRPGNGTVSAASSNTGVATVSVSNPAGSNPVVTISQVNQTTGTATVTISVAAGDNYTSPANQTVAVTAQFMPAKKALNDQTWAEIRQVSDAGNGSEYWNVGDRKGVLVNGTVGTLAVNQTLYVYILGFDHNASKEGSGIHFGTFKTALTGGTDVCLVDDSYGSYKDDGIVFNMNHFGCYNNGGWKACDLRYDILGSTNTAPKNYGKQRSSGDIGYDASADTVTNPVANTLMSALPSDLRLAMKPITKYTDNISGGVSDTAVNVTSSVDYLPLLSECEIFGSRKYSSSYELNYQSQYAYYRAGNSRVKYRHNSADSTASWLERSPCFTNHDFYFCVVNKSGSSSICFVHASMGLAPAFMV